MTDELTKAERAAVASLAWMEHWNRKEKQGASPAQLADILLLKQLREIYGD